jgi:GNAT superfamily N-acetyltransferase
MRPAAGADAEAVRAFYFRGREAEFRPLGLPPAMLSVLLDGQFRAQQAGYGAQFPDLQTLLMIREGAMIGRLMLARDAGGAGAASLRVVDIAIDKSCRGRGLGERALTLVAEAARAAGFSALTLEVQIDNAVARRLYARLGFVTGNLDPAGISVAMRKPLG